MERHTDTGLQFFNFVLSITWPSLLVAFKPQGAFGWYAAWNVVGWFGALTVRSSNPLASTYTTY